ncbi:MAG TPA: zf-HC2 domain-containing protein [Nitriliruptorales bacterium]|nr:zf-HC2 domain-containing protein [Nitriliruptorales bacterium]
MRKRRWGRRSSVARDCHEVAEVLQTYVDGELDAATAMLVADHLEDCRRCGMEASAYRDMKARLARLADAADPAAVDRLKLFVDGLTKDG